MNCAELEIRDFRTEVAIGWTEGERARPQTLSLDLHVRFSVPPAGGRTDELAGTVCYDILCQHLLRVIHARPRRLIESLTHDLAESLRPLLPPGADFRVSVTKVHPPVEGLRGGARYTESGRA